MHRLYVVAELFAILLMMKMMLVRNSVGGRRSETACASQSGAD